MRWTILGMVECALTGVLVVVLLSVFFGGSSARSLARRYREFDEASQANDQARAASACAAVAERLPNNRLFALQAAAMKLGTHKKAARKEIEAIARDVDASPRSRALAEVVLASLSIASKTTEKTLAFAVSHAEKAVKLDPECGDGHAVLGILKARQGLHGEAIQSIDKALKAKTPPSPAPLAEAYLARGLCHSAEGDTSAARDDYLCALAIRPGWKKAEDATFAARLAGTCDVKISAARRRKLVKDLEANGGYRDRMKRPEALLTIGMAYHLLGDSSKAAAKLQSASRHPAMAAAANVNLAAFAAAKIAKQINAVEEQRLIALAKHAKQAHGGTPFTLSAPTIPAVLTPKDVDSLDGDLQTFLGRLESAIASGSLSPEQQTSLKSAVAVVRVWRLVQRPSGVKPEARLQGAFDALEPLRAGSTDPWVLRTYAALLLGAGRYTESVDALRKAGKAAPDDPDLQRLLARMTAKPTFSNFTPGLGTSNFLTPLIGVDIQVHAGPAPASQGKVALEIDGRKVGAVLEGASVSYLAQTPMGDGEHVVAITYTDAYGNQAQASHKFYIDNAPPYVKKLTPGQNQAVAGPRPTFVLEYTDDGSGVDPSSLSVIMSTVTSTGPPFRHELIKDGKYTFSTYSEPKFTRGDAATPGKATFTSRKELSKGTYVIEFTFQDNRGIEVRDKRWIFKIM